MKFDIQRLLSEQRVSLTNLAREEGLSPPTTWRWSTKGVRGICLETFMLGGRRQTTREAYKRFVQATTDATSVGPQKARTKSQRQATIARTNAALDAMGVV